ncbi:MAG: hypothetical protein AB1637_02515 [Elusimicrobiota bacterium]
MLTKISETTDANGLADVRLRLGNIPAEYTVTAKCDGCVPEFATVNFTSCGKLHTDEFKQNDDRWGDDILGSNPPAYKIRQTGCALTSVANLINFYAAINTSIARTDPGILNEEMIKKGGYNNNDDVLWDRVPDFLYGVKFAGIIAVNNIHSLSSVINVIDEYLLRGLPVIFHVLKANNRDHFMLAIGKCKDRYVIIDPAIGIIDDYNPFATQLILQGVRLYEPF